MLRDTSPGVTVALVSSNTRITLPYSIPIDGAEGTLLVIRDSTGEIIPSTMTAPGQITVTDENLLGVSLWIGVSYASYWQFSVIYKRDTQSDLPDLRGRLNLRYVKLHYHNTKYFRVTVKAMGRTARTYTLSLPSAGDGTFSIPIQSRNIHTTITVSSDYPDVSGSPHPANFSGYEWEGVYYNRISGGR